ncbi:MAG: response regulator, partial [Phycisphaerales bacterium]|nr:response regulator [Phycisphaerales bacterium]
MSDPHDGIDSDSPERASLSTLALDDDPDFREFIREALESEGHEVRIAATPEECYRACEERLPDVLLLDMKMGRHSGEQVLEEVRRRWPRLCVVVVTGYPT